MKNPSFLWSVFDQSQPSSPIIVKIIEPAKSELSGLSDVLIEGARGFQPSEPSLGTSSARYCNATAGVFFSDV